MTATLKPNSFYGQIRAAVTRLGVATTKEILAEVGGLIPPDEAIRCARRELVVNDTRRKTARKRASYTTDKLVAMGRRFKVNVALSSLVRIKHLVRVAPGTYRLAGKPVPVTLCSRVQEVINRLGEVTISQAVEGVRNFIPAAQATRAYHRKDNLNRKNHPSRNRVPKSLARMIESGRRICVTEALHSLAKRGCIRNVAKGVFATTKPRLFDPRNAVG